MKISREAKKRYPPDGRYHDGINNLICTCKQTCNNPCKGECGCKACKNAYQDFLSME